VWSHALRSARDLLDWTGRSVLSASASARDFACEQPAFILFISFVLFALALASFIERFAAPRPS